MRLIKRLIRKKHVQAVANGILYFSPCKTFLDLLEFRFGYCWDAFRLARERGDPGVFDECIRKSFADEHVRKRINETVISCWSYSQESPWMWEVYGQSDAAIIVTAEAGEIQNYVRNIRGDAAPAGAVRYDFSDIVGPS